MHAARGATCLAVGLAPVPAFADALQLQVLASARQAEADVYAFTQTTTVQRSSEQPKPYVMRFDPARPPGARWMLISSEGHAPTTKESAGATKQANAAPVPSYARIARWFGAPAVRVATTKDSVTYRFPALPKGTLKIGSHDASADTIAEVIVNTSGKTAFAERIRFISSTPFRMALVAKIERFVFTTTHQLRADGRPVIQQVEGDMSGSLFGKADWFKTRTIYSDIRAAR